MNFTAAPYFTQTVSDRVSCPKAGEKEETQARVSVAAAQELTTGKIENIMLYNVKNYCCRLRTWLNKRERLMSEHENLSLSIVSM